MKQFQITRRNFLESAMGVILLMMVVPTVSDAIQPDAEYRARQKQFGKQ